MARSSYPSDSIALKEISTGGQYAGNGGNGYSKGDISNEPSITFKPSNKADGADVHVNTGDHVQQKAYWDAGGANANADWHSKAYGGDANSNGDQSSSSGHNTSQVHADTTAYQTNFLLADMHQDVAAGIGGYGGDGNTAQGGDVDFVHI
jgi:hypothetical protein